MAMTRFKRYNHENCEQNAYCYTSFERLSGVLASSIHIVRGETMCRMADAEAEYLLLCYNIDECTT